MWTWLQRLFGPRLPSKRQLMACEDHVEGLESRVEQHYAELKALRGFVYAKDRKARRENPSEDAPQEEIEEQPSPQLPPLRAANLSRRFRRF